MRSLFLTVLVLLLPPAVDGQKPDARTASVTGGIGNVMGWFGLQAERYVTDERISGFVGLGYTPSVDGSASGPTFAAGIRGFTRGATNRGFLSLSISQIVVESNVANPQQLYGPALEVGWQYVARGGFTMLASAGVGYAPGVSQGLKKVHEVVALGFGYTWRRRG